MSRTKTSSLSFNAANYYLRSGFSTVPKSLKTDFVWFLAYDMLTQFLQNNTLLEHLEVVFDGNDNEESRRREFDEAVGGAADHQEQLFSVMTFKGNMFGDEFSFNLEVLRKMMGIYKEEGFGGVKGFWESMSGDFSCKRIKYCEDLV
jgi:hypothetical protein